MHVITLVLSCLASARAHIRGPRVQGKEHEENQNLHRGAATALMQSSGASREFQAVKAVTGLLMAFNPTAGRQVSTRSYGQSLAPITGISNRLAQQPSPLADHTAGSLNAVPRAQRPVMQFSFESFDRDCIRLLTEGQKEAKEMGASALGTEHLLFVATREQDEVQESLARAGVTAFKLRKLMDSIEKQKPRVFGSKKQGNVPFGDDTTICLKASVALAPEDEQITWKNLILTVLESDASEAVKLIRGLEVDPDNAIREVKRGKVEPVDAGAGSKRKKKGKASALQEATVDLTQKARDGELDPLIGRSMEVQRAMQVLCRRRKNNPVLIGDPGVGKTAIAEGLAQLIIEDQVPPMLQNKRLLSLELGLVVADTKYRGEFEQKLADILDEVSAADDIILFIDELHTLIGAGSDSGGMDAANLMKPSLARGELQCLGATTIDEYRKYIEKDAALERRFQPITIPETTIEETTEILTRLSPAYEKHHEVLFTPEALEAASKMSARYISDRFLPDKAIDLMDQAGALVQTMGYLEDEYYVEDNIIKEATVDEEDVAQVISAWTGIPLSKLTDAESKTMLNVESKLHDRVIGQDFAVSAIARALRRARVGLGSPQRPVASMIFCGPTGVGKTELAKAVAEFYYGDEKAMIRLDMSEYMSPNDVSRLTGPPPGYVGYEEGGQLTSAVRRTPHTVILFDEVEKAHPDVFNSLLQVLDDGRLTDNKGRVVDFANTLLILTSNVGSKRILSMPQTANVIAGREDVEYAKMRKVVKEELGKKFRPEFLNRLDEIIVFEGLKVPEATNIAGLMLNDLVLRAAESEIELSPTQALTTALVDSGYSTQYGARPLRRAVQRLCEDAVAQAILEGFVKQGEKLVIDHDSKETVILENQRGKKFKFLPTVAQGIETGSDGIR